MSALRNEKQLLRFEYDFAVNGGAIGAIALTPDITQLKAGMIVTDIIVHAEVALASAGSATVTFGDGSDVDAFLADSSGALDALNDIVRAENLKVLMAGTPVLTMTVGVAALTAGKLEVYLEVISK
jgi:hypothetical protein